MSSYLNVTLPPTLVWKRSRTSMSLSWTSHGLYLAEDASYKLNFYLKYTSIVQETFFHGSRIQAFSEFKVQALYFISWDGGWGQVVHVLCVTEGSHESLTSVTPTHHPPNEPWRSLLAMKVWRHSSSRYLTCLKCGLYRRMRSKEILKVILSCCNFLEDNFQVVNCFFGCFLGENVRL